MVAAFLFGAFFLLLAFGVPIGFSMLLSSALGLIVFDLGPLSILGSVAFNGIYSFTTLAIPFYILAGTLMANGGIAKSLCDFFKSLLGWITGGLGMVTMAACTFFAAISGSGTATTAAIGKIMVPEMEKSGYDKHYSLAIAAAGGVVGPIIPPSTAFVLFGIATGASIGDLFKGGVLPGVLIGVLMCIMIYLTSKKRGMGKPADGEKIRFSLMEVFKTLWAAKWALSIPFIILGGIYGGIFTPTEAGAVACVAAILISMFITKTLNFKGLIDACIESAVITATIMIMVAASAVFSRVLTMAQIPQALTAAMAAIASNKFSVLLIINIALLILGCVMEATPLILILSPILAGIANQFGIPLVHLGVLMSVNLCIGMITPPVGVCLFTAGVIGNTPYEKIVKEIWPFLFVQIIALILINAIPWLSMAFV